MSLAAFISAIWAGFSPAPKRRRNIRVNDPDSIEPINHWFPGNRSKKQPRRLVETPTAGHWPEHRVAKRTVGKGRKRCRECGALVKGVGPSSGNGNAKGAARKTKGAGKGKVARSLRGRTVEYVAVG